MSYSKYIRVLKSYDGLVAGRVYQNFFEESQAGNQMNHCLKNPSSDNEYRVTYISKKFCEDFIPVDIFADLLKT